MAYLDLPISLSTVTEEEATGPIALVVSTTPPYEFHPDCIVSINGFEGLVPDPDTKTKWALPVTVDNDTRAVGDYYVQVRFPDARVTPPVVLAITATPAP